MLQPGETVIYCGGWHAPVRLKVIERASTRGKRLDESEIRRCGQQQLWVQRKFLLPRLATHPAMNDAETLSEFLRAAMLMLGMLLRLNPKVPAQDSLLRERLRKRLLQKWNLWLEVGSMDEDLLADGLSRVFRDGVVNSPFSSEADFALLKPGIWQAIQRLQESLADFDQFAKGLESNEIFSIFAQLDSI